MIARRAYRAAALAIVASLVLAGGSAAAGGPARAATPPGFFGAAAELSMAARGDARERVFDGLSAIGIETVRQPVYWRDVETRRGEWDWSQYDAWIADATRRGVEVLPILFGSPPWATRPSRARGTAPPDPVAFADFAARAVDRYGRGGEFWLARPDLRYSPVGAWEVWNEPNLRGFWSTGVDAGEYARLLSLTSAAIHRLDARAMVVSAGLPDSGPDRLASKYLERLYRAGAGPSIDAVGLHPYAASPRDAIASVERARRVMARHGARRVPVWVTEYGYSTGPHPSRYTVSSRAQAARIARTTREMVHRRRSLRLERLIVYSLTDSPPWPGTPPFWGLSCGLFRLDGRPKPAAFALQRAIGRSRAPIAPLPAVLDVLAGG